MERRLVGTWQIPSTNEYPLFIVLRPDRRIQIFTGQSFSSSGQWSASRSILTYQWQDHGLRGSIERLMGRRPDWRFRMKIATDDAGSLTLTNLEQQSLIWKWHSDDVPEEHPRSVIVERTN